MAGRVKPPFEPPNLAPARRRSDWLRLRQASQRWQTRRTLDARVMSAARRSGRLRRRSERPQRSGCPGRRSAAAVPASPAIARAGPEKRSVKSSIRRQQKQQGSPACAALPAHRAPKRADTPRTGSSIAESLHPPRHRVRWRSGAPFTGIVETCRCVSELGREIAVDLEPDADFDKDRSCPRHVRFLWSEGPNQVRTHFGVPRQLMICPQGLLSQASFAQRSVFTVLMLRSRISVANNVGPLHYASI